MRSPSRGDAEPVVRAGPQPKMVEVVSAGDDPALWNAFVRTRPEATLAHAWEWGEAIARAYGHPTHRFMARAGGAVTGVLPLVEVRSRLFGARLASMPYLDSGGILARDGAAWTALAAAARDLGRQLGIRKIELRQASPPLLAAPVRRDRARLVLALPRSADPLWKAIGSKTRNQVRKGEKAGLTVERAGREGVAAFYGVWRGTMRDLGSPAHRRAWFESVVDAFGERAAIYLVRRAEDVVGGLVAIEFGDTVAVPWAGADRRAFSLSPNNILYWTAIREAVGRGARRFDFGRSAIGSGTYHFKRQWGAADELLYWQTLDAGDAADPILAPGEEPPVLPAAPPDSRPRAAAARLWRLLPVPVATWLGGRLRGGITL